MSGNPLTIEVQLSRQDHAEISLIIYFYDDYIISLRCGQLFLFLDKFSSREKGLRNFLSDFKKLCKVLS